MKQQLQELLYKAIVNLQKDKILPKDLELTIQIEPARDKQHGDYASNIAMMLAKTSGMKPRELAERIKASIRAEEFIKEIKIAGPGFINFYISTQALHKIIPTILEQQSQFGHSAIGQKQKINIEFVSANPTGPLHVGHGRGAAFGATLADLLNYAGYDARREYYVNDAGRQMNILAVSIWLRYLELCGAEFSFPSNGYKGEYIIEIAKNMHDEFADSLYRSEKLVFEDIPADLNEAGAGDKEAHIDALIQRAKTLLGNDYEKVFQKGLQIILEDIREDLAAFGVTFDEWFSEKSLQQSGAIQHAINKLKANGHLYERNGAIWFNSIPFGDDKDRVVIRENGQTTYFASDLAYLLNKFERGYERAIYIFGADHHGYVARLKAAAQALGIDPDKVDIILVQFAVLFRGEEKISMSTRSGSFVTLRELREEVGKDAARFFYIMRKSEQHMDFDLELAKSESYENPVYYIQYAHARICSVFRQLQQRQLVYDQNLGLQHLDLLDNDHEKALLTCLSRYPELIEAAAKNYEPHLVANYLRELATDLHEYYNAHQFIVEDEGLRNARLCLIQAVQQVLANGLTLLGLNAPEQM